MAVVGYIKLSKKILGWAWYDNINVFKIFIHLLLTAEYQERKIGRLTLARGQAFIKQAEIAEMNGMSRQQVRAALNCLRDTGEIETKVYPRKGTVVTVSNYTKYQDFVGKTQPQNNHKPNHETTTRKPDNNADFKHPQNAEQPQKNAKIAKTQPNYILYKKRKNKDQETLSGVRPMGRIEKRSDDFIPGYDF